MLNDVARSAKRWAASIPLVHDRYLNSPPWRSRCLFRARLVPLACRGGSRLLASARFVWRRKRGNRGDRETEMHSGHCNEREGGEKKGGEERESFYAKNWNPHNFGEFDFRCYEFAKKNLTSIDNFSIAINKYWDLFMACL